MSEADSGPDLLNELAYEFAERFRRGERPSLTEYTGKHPELAAEIRDLFPALVVIEQFGSVAGPATGPDARNATAEGPAPRQLGEYRILREVARGGMGIVYEAVQESLGRHVALKVLPFQSMADSNHLERFRREAQAAAKLHHTNIVPVFGVGEHEGVHYFAMQFIKGQPLNSVLHELKSRRQPKAPDAGEPAKAPSSVPAGRPNLELTVTLADGLRTGRFPGNDEVHCDRPEDGPPPRVDPVGLTSSGHGPRNAMVSGDESDLSVQSNARYFRSVARVGVQVAEALAYAHQQGIVHRDIKPSNLLLDTQGTVWITDFGLAKSEGTDELTSPGDLLGTLRYMAPERFQGQADPRSDVYSLGLTLYEMVTLRPAFAAAERAQLIERMLHAEPPRPRQLDDRIPRDLETLILKAIAKEPGRRYQTAGALAKDLERFLADRPIMARPVTVLERAVKWAKRRPAIAALAVVVHLLLAALLVMGIWSYVEINRSLAAARVEAGKATAINEFLVNDLLMQADPEKNAVSDRLTLRQVLDRAAERVGSRFRTRPLLEAALRTTMAKTYAHLGDWSECRRQAAAVVDIYQRAKGPWAVETANAMILFGGAILNEGDAARAEPIVRQGLDVLCHVRGEDHPDTLWAMYILADAVKRQGKEAEAETLIVKAVEASRRVQGDEHPKTIAYMSELAVVNRVQGKLSQAESLAVKALEISRRVNGAENPWTISYLEELGRVYQAQGKLSEAERLFGEVVETRSRVMGEEHGETPRVMRDLANLYLVQGKLSQAEPLSEKRLEITRRVQGAEHRDTLNAMYDLTLVYLRQDKLPDAERVFRQAEVLRKKRPFDAPDRRMALIYGKLGDTFNRTGRIKEAAAACREAQAVYEIFVAKAPDQPGSQNNLARWLATCPVKELHDPRRSVELAKKAVELAPKQGTFWNTLGVAYYRAGDWKAAIEALTKSMDLRKGGDSNDWFFLAMAHWQLGDKPQARSWYDKAVPWMEKNQPMDEELVCFRAEAAGLLGLEVKRD